MYKKLAVFTVALSALIVAASSTAWADAAQMYGAKCASCHAADGSGSATGKKMGTHDLKSPEVQAMTDAQLTEIIAKGKNKMPGYEKRLSAEEITALVAHLRDMAKK